MANHINNIVIFFLLSSCMLFSCKIDKHENQNASQSVIMGVEDLSFEVICTNNKRGRGYRHYIYISNYNPKDYHFYSKTIDITQNYIDTVTVNSPVQNVYFVKSKDGFPPDLDNEYFEWGTIQANTLIGFYISADDSNMNSAKKIIKILIYENGMPKIIPVDKLIIHDEFNKN